MRRYLTFSLSVEQILFRVQGEVRPTSGIRTVPLAGGPGTELYAVEQNGLLSHRVSFLSEDELVAVSADGTELHRVSAGGGTPELIAPLTGRPDQPEYVLAKGEAAEALGL